MFTNPVVGGTQLIRNAIQSANFVPGVSGWIIRRDGSSEFASGTFRGPVLIIDPITQATLASIGSDGSASFQTVDATDVFIGGASVGSILSKTGRGIVGQYQTGAQLPNPGVSLAYANLIWTQFRYDVTRMYKVTLSSASFKNTAAVTTSDLVIRVLFNQPGLAGGASNEIVHYNRNSASSSQAQSIETSFYLVGSTGRVNGASTITLQAAADGNITWNHIDFSTTNQVYWTVEDVGPAPTFTGGVGAPAGQLTYTSRYYATGSRSYDGSNNPISAPDRDNNVYLSTFSDRSPLVDEQFHMIFPGAQIRADLAGSSSIVYARLWLYCFKAEEAKGTLGFGITPDTTLKATWANNQVGQTWGKDDNWPIPGWAYFDLLTTGGGHRAIDEFLAPYNGNSVLGQEPFIPGIAATGFRGVGTGAPYIPYIEIQYIGNSGTGLDPGGGGGTGVTGSWWTQPQIEEIARDAIGTALVAGSGITVAVDDTANTITVSSAGGGGGFTQPQIEEFARDAIGTALVAGKNFQITVNDVADTITIGDYPLPAPVSSGAGGTNSIAAGGAINTWIDLVTNVANVSITNPHPTAPMLVSITLAAWLVTPTTGTDIRFCPRTTGGIVTAAGVAGSAVSPPSNGFIPLNAIGTASVSFAATYQGTIPANSTVNFIGQYLTSNATGIKQVNYPGIVIVPIRYT